MLYRPLPLPELKAHLPLPRCPAGLPLSLSVQRPHAHVCAVTNRSIRHPPVSVSVRLRGALPRRPRVRPWKPVLIWA